MKPVIWVSSAKKDLSAMPDEVRGAFGYALWVAQIGGKHVQAKTLQGFGDASVLEVVENDAGGTYRAVYTVRFAEAVVVLHCFQKKSVRGIATPKADMDLIRRRLKDAELLIEELRHHAHGKKTRG
ncbi:MAG: type II toxin-antitoxin system RelE/ParE family toxin [Candidatus Accumulibacter sp.]|jgi:phage-related protein|nr:type II toxin-antitoxin system RelE/ParE family toxin [Accumulibacter sp.]